MDTGKKRKMEGICGGYQRIEKGSKNSHKVADPKKKKNNPQCNQKFHRYCC